VDGVGGEVVLLAVLLDTGDLAIVSISVLTALRIGVVEVDPSQFNRLPLLLNILHACCRSHRERCYLCRCTDIRVSHTLVSSVHALSSRGDYGHLRAL
jgi:hypothetical protein